MKIKLIALIMALAMMASMLVACNGKKNEEGAEKPSTEPTEKIPANTLVLAKDGKSEYSIVYPMKQTWVADYAQTISKAIEEQTGASLPVKHDSERGASEYEIRVAEVKGSRKEVFDVYKELGGSSIADTDFAIKVVGKTVYLYGLGSQGISSAVEYFLGKVLAFGETIRYAGVANDFLVAYNRASTPEVTVTKTNDEYYVEFSLGAGQLVETFCRLSYTGNGGWRLQSKKRASEAFDDFGAAQRLAFSLGELPPSKVYPVTVSVDEADGTVTVREDGGSYVTLSTEPFALNFYTASGKCASTIDDVYTASGGSTLVGKLQDGEAVFGTGERFNTVNQRGRIISLVSRDVWSRDTACYAAIPLLALSRGSGIFMNRYEVMDLDLGKTVKDEWRISVNGTPVDCYVFTTEELSDVLYGYSALTGFAEQPEEWTYGMLTCRFSPDLSQKWTVDVTWYEENWGKNHDGSATADGRGIGVYDAIAKMEEYDLPWTGVLAEGFGAYTNEKKMKDLKELCDYVHSLGKKLMLYITAGGGMSENWVGMNSPSASYFVAQTLPDGTLNYALPLTDPLTNNPDSNGEAHFYLDVTNPAACEWFFNEVWQRIAVEAGVDGCKIDFCEMMPENYELNYYSDEIDTQGSHHWYPVAFGVKFWEMVSSKPDSGMCYIRGGGIGLQRAPYVWAGDQKREFKSLSYQLTCVLASGLSGIPFMSYDMSGYEYKGGRAWKDALKTGNFWYDPSRSLAYESQVFIRGLQFSAFTICLETMGTVRWAWEFAEDGDCIYVKNEDGVVVPKLVYTTDEQGNRVPAKDKHGNDVYEYDYVYERDAATGEILKDKEGKAKIVRDEYGNPVLSTPGTYAYVTDIYRAYIKLHELLTPYLTEYSAIACETGMPLMRHMVLSWQDDANVYDIDDQYTLGDAFLIAPVLTNGYSRDIYLPEGEWIDLNTGDAYTITKETPVEERWLRDYQVSITTLPVFYNVNTTSETAPGLLSGIAEIFAHLDEIEAGIPAYLIGTLK